MQLFQPVAHGHRFERSSFEHGCTRFVQVSIDAVGPFGLRLGLRLGSETERKAVVVCRDERTAGCSGSQCRIAAHHHEQVLTLAARTQNVHLAHGLQLLERLRNVEHGGEFQHHAARNVKQLCLQAAHVGFAVGNQHRFAAGSVAPCGVEKHHVGAFHAVQIFRSVGTHHSGLLQTQQGKIMTGQFAERGLPFYVDRAVKAWSNERKVNAQSAREVGIRQRCFVPPGMA